MFGRNGIKNKGFTLIELMIVVAILGILAAVAIPSFIKYMTRAKTSEAATALKAMHDGAVAYYGAEHATAGTDTVLYSACLPDSQTWTPASIASGQKNDAEVNAFTASTWQALDFAMADDYYYSYQFVNHAMTGNGCSLSSGTIIYEAAGDLDGDSITSLFQRWATITNGEVRATGGYFKTDPLE